MHSDEIQTFAHDQSNVGCEPFFDEIRRMKVRLLHKTRDQLNGPKNVIDGHVWPLVGSSNVFEHGTEERFQDIRIVNIDQIEKKGDLSCLCQIVVHCEESIVRARGRRLRCEILLDECRQLPSVQYEVRRHRLKMLAQECRSIEEGKESKEMRRTRRDRPVDEMNDRIQHGRVSRESKDRSIGMKLC